MTSQPVTPANLLDAMVRHNWSGGEVCSCGSDTVICQGCGHPVCGEVAIYGGTLKVRGNVGPCCFAKFGMGHQGGAK